jgi:predicted AAA+ superfamily ATPase
LFKRFIERSLREALEDTPVVLVIGPRRAGKTTLARAMATGERAYLTLDDQTVLEAAEADPAGFVRGLDRAIIDEVQRAPKLLLAIKRSVDDDKRPGRFLLTGSANVLMLPKVADSLAGRMQTIQMLPFSRSEIVGRQSAFLDNLFTGRWKRPRDVSVGDALVEIVLTGGYPESIARPTERRRQAWMRAYLESVLTRDLREIAEIEKLTDLPRFVRLLAEHAGQLVNYSAIGNGINVTYKTSQRYVGLLEQVFLTATLQPWFTSSVKRVVKTPKLQFLDPGILAASKGLTLARTTGDRQLFGALLECFVFAELLKLASWSDLRVVPYHFRDLNGGEVDIVLERDDGAIVGLEVKASATVGSQDFYGIKKLATAAGKRFVGGVVLYDGETVVPFGERMAAVPISSLWN